MRVEDYMKKINGKDKEQPKYVKSIVKRTLISICSVLIVLILCNLSAPLKKFINKYVFETNYNFAKINSIYKKYFLDLTKDVKDKDTGLVSSNQFLEYSSIKDYNDGAELSVSDNFNVQMLESGLVVFVGEKEGYGSSVIVQQSNGVDVIYGNVNAGDVKVYDYVEKGTIIGSASKKLYLVFMKDGEALDYETYIK